MQSPWERVIGKYPVIVLRISGGPFGGSVVRLTVRNVSLGIFTLIVNLRRILCDQAIDKKITSGKNMIGGCLFFSVGSFVFPPIALILVPTQLCRYKK